MDAALDSVKQVLRNRLVQSIGTAINAFLDMTRLFDSRAPIVNMAPDADEWVFARFDDARVVERQARADRAEIHHHDSPLPITLERRRVIQDNKEMLSGGAGWNKQRCAGVSDPRRYRLSGFARERGVVGVVLFLPGRSGTCRLVVESKRQK